jgi:hypothetical protein
MHDELWASAELKIAHASFFFDQMGRSLYWDRTARFAVIMAAGGVVGNSWHQAFYAYLDAFLAMGRSVPEVVNCCFGKDKRNKVMRDWFNGLSAAEKSRREIFTTQFDCKDFSELPLSTARNITLHREGVAPVEVTITGLFGVYTGSPTKAIPTWEMRPTYPGDDPAAQLAAAERPVSLGPPVPDAFMIAGKPLFAECQAYIAKARILVTEARAIAERVHGSDVLTFPPPTRPDRLDAARKLDDDGD